MVDRNDDENENDSNESDDCITPSLQGLPAMPLRFQKILHGECVDKKKHEEK
jgi:hypothetical protein